MWFLQLLQLKSLFSRAMLGLLTFAKWRFRIESWTKKAAEIFFFKKNITIESSIIFARYLHNSSSWVSEGQSFPEGLLSHGSG